MKRDHIPIDIKRGSRSNYVSTSLFEPVSWILKEKENYRKEKFIQNRSEENISSGEVNINNSEQIQEQDIVETSNEETKIEKSEKSQAEIN